MYTKIIDNEKGILIDVQKNVHQYWNLATTNPRRAKTIVKTFLWLYDNNIYRPSLIH